jgi:hypothetical protein
MSVRAYVISRQLPDQRAQRNGGLGAVTTSVRRITLTLTRPTPLHALFNDHRTYRNAAMIKPSCFI